MDRQHNRRGGRGGSRGGSRGDFNDRKHRHDPSIGSRLPQKMQEELEDQSKYYCYYYYYWILFLTWNYQ